MFANRYSKDVRLGSFTNQRQVTELQALLTDLATTARPIMYSVSLYARADSSPHYLELTIIKVQPSPNKPCFPSHPQLNHYGQILHNSKVSYFRSHKTSIGIDVLRNLHASLTYIPYVHLSGPQIGGDTTNISRRRCILFS